MLNGIIFLLLAILYGCGMGGGGLLVVYLTMACGMAQGDAQALNLFFYVIASTSSALLLLRRRAVDPRLVMLCAAAGIPGAYFGSVLREMISVGLLQKIFGVLLVVTGASVFFSGAKSKE